MRLSEVVISVPHTGQLRAELVAWLFQAQAAGCRIDLPQNRPLDLARNVQVRRFLEFTAAPALLMVDSDTVPPPHALPTLLSANRAVVSALVPYWSYADRDLLFNAYRFDEDNNLRSLPRIDGLTACDALGFGCVLAKREVFEAIEPPWFRWQLSEDGLSLAHGEDLYFCEQVREAGFSLHVHGGVLCDHYHTFNLTELGRVLHEANTGQKAT